jgi:RNA polymerase sigma factor (sigma-70 family)
MTCQRCGGVFEAKSQRRYCSLACAVGVSRSVEAPIGDAGPPSLTAEQERLVLEHINWSESGAWKYARAWGGQFDFTELRSAAYEGLVIAARKFDPSRGVTFKSYAFNWIDSRIKLVKRKWRRAHGWSYQATKQEQASGLAKNSMVRLVHVGEWPINEEGDQLDVAAPEIGDERGTDDVDYRRMLVMGTVTNARTRHIMALRFDGLMYHEIGQKIGLTKQRIYQIERAAITRAQRRLKATHPALFSCSATRDGQSAGLGTDPPRHGSDGIEPGHSDSVSSLTIAEPLDAD